MNMPTIRFKRLLPDAIIPTRATDGSAGFDLYCVDRAPVENMRMWRANTGIAAAIPHGWVGLVRGRSSMALQGARFFDGTIDSDYRGEISVLVDWLPADYVGKRIAQLVVVPYCCTAVEVDELDDTVRGKGGWGSTGQ